MSNFSNRYGSDIDRHTHEQSLSPIPPSYQPQIIATDTDAINNNVELNVPRRSTLSRSPRQELNPPGSPSQTVKFNSDLQQSPDARLNEWLIKQGIDSTSRNIILNEAFSFDDFVYELQKEDLLRIGLK